MPIWKWLQLGCCPFFYSFKLYICQDSRRIARACTAQNNIKSSRLACLAQRLSAFTSRCGTDTAGRRALEPPPEDSARTNLLDREFQFRELHTPPADVVWLRNKVAQKKRFWAYLYQVDVQTKHAQNEKHFNSTKRNNIKRRIKAIYCYWYNTHSSGRIMFVLQPL